MKWNSFLFAPENDGGQSAGGSSGGGTLFSGGTSSEGSSQQGAGTATASTAGGSAAAEAGAAAPWSWAKEDGAFNQGWHDRLPADLKDNASLRTIQTLPDLAKAFVETKGMVGKKLEMPGANATPEQIADWRKTVGAPDKPEGYRGEAKHLKPENLPDELWNAEAEGKFLAIAHKHHLAPAAVKEILDFYGGSLADTLKVSQEEAATSLAGETTKLREKWGTDFDSKLSDASRMATVAGLDPKTDPIFTSARAVEAFAKIARLISGDKLISGETPSLSNSVNDRIKDITDGKSQSMLAREYRGEFGTERQQSAQAQLHAMMASQKQK